jgi:hypothetical protein
MYKASLLKPPPFQKWKAVPYIEERIIPNMMAGKVITLSMSEIIS